MALGASGFVGREVGKGKSLSGLGLGGSFSGLSSASTVLGKKCLWQQLFFSKGSFLANVCQTEMILPFIIGQRNPSYSLYSKGREIDLPPPWEEIQSQVARVEYREGSRSGDIVAWKLFS